MYRVLKLKESENKEFRYITTHGIGPGTVPDGVFIRSEDLDNGKTAIYLNRPLTDEELKKYDIKPEWIQESLTEAEEDEEEENAEDIQDNIEAAEELEDTIDSEADQDENPVEEESELDKQLDELRDILVDLDLNLYRVASKEDPNNVIYIIGKVAEDSNDTLMLIDTKPEEVNEPEIEEPIIDDVEVDEAISGTDAQIEDAKKDSKEKGLYSEDEEIEIEDKEEEELETPEERFDFVVLPKTFDEINKLNPRYGEELTPDHEAIIDYLMNCLIEVNPEAAEELADNKDDESNQELPVPQEDIDVDIDIDREEDLI